jgi:hypothetical protein
VIILVSFLSGMLFQEVAHISLLPGSFSPVQSARAPTHPDVLIINASNVEIDSFFENYLLGTLNNLSSPYPKTVVLAITSLGGFLASSDELGNRLRLFQNRTTTKIFFYVKDYCLSGCFILSTYIKGVYMGNLSAYGFGHNSTHLFYREAVAVVEANKHWNETFVNEILPKILTGQEAYHLGMINGTSYWTPFTESVIHKVAQLKNVPDQEVVVESASVPAY